ncbi:MAG: acyl-CoA dehydrogenase family protein, partial [Vulcanimicrobiaceae bacterium]
MNTRARAPENQTPPLENVDLFAYDRPLVEALAQAAPAMQTVELSEIGHLASEPQWIQAGFDANERPPELHAYDRTGARIDEVRFDPAWHALVRVAVERGLHAAPWRDLAPSAHLRRAAKFYLWSQNEAGHGCPISMTYAAVPALRHAPAIAARWEPALASRVYDPRLIPIEQKAGALCGMGMTEKQGGSDVRATQTRAVRTRAFGGDGEYLVTGDKWFCSAPMCDAFLVLA